MSRSSNDLFVRQVADVDGDDRADIVGFGGDRMFIANGRSDGTFGPGAADLASFGPFAGDWTSQHAYPRELGDINGDGQADVVGFGSAGVYVSRANDFF